MMVYIIVAILTQATWLYFAHIDRGPEQIADYSAAYIAPTIIISVYLIIKNIRDNRP